jgi:hypothetical protein
VTNYSADQPSSAGTAVTQKSGTASADAVPAGCTLLLFNSGAGAHNVDLSIGFVYDGNLSPGSAGAPGKRRIPITAGQYLLVGVRSDSGDANGLVQLTIDGTASEVKYWVMA